MSESRHPLEWCFSVHQSAASHQIYLARVWAAVNVSILHWPVPAASDVIKWKKTVKELIVDGPFAP